MDSLLGMVVERSLPSEVLLGLMTGQYSLHGGVIRWAKGTDAAGQIVRHLLPVAGQAATSVASLVPGLSLATGAVNSFQLASLGRSVAELQQLTGTVLAVASGTAVLAGLNLGVSAVSFAVLNRRLKGIEAQLTELQQDVREIKEFLAREERSKLSRAFENLAHLDRNRDQNTRRQVLHDTHQDLIDLAGRYLEQFRRAPTLRAALAAEEYLFATALAKARCSADLGEPGRALAELESSMNDWESRARTVTKDFVLGDSPERFLHPEFADLVPAAALCEWMDFAHAEERGFDWLDELRGGLPKWAGRPSLAGRLGSVVRPGASRAQAVLQGRELEAPAACKFVARRNLLSGHVGDMELLASKSLLPTQLEEMVEGARASATEGFLLLKPEPAAA